MNTPAAPTARPLAAHLTKNLVATHRGGQVLALAAFAVGMAFSLREAAPATDLYAVQGGNLTRLRADGGEVEDRGPVVSSAAPAGSAVAVLTIDGPLVQCEEDTFCGYIQGYDGIRSRLRAVLEDAQVGAVVLRIKSPGGDVAGLDEGCRLMRADIERSGKQVFVQIDEMACSAAYRLAAALSTGGIYLPESGQVGCIGTITALWSESRALDEAGYDVELICDPPGKSAGWPQQPISDLARSRANELIRASTAVFVDAVAKDRGIAPQAVRDINGATLQGSTAVRAGLADGIQGLPETIVMAAEAARGAALRSGGSAPSATAARAAKTHPAKQQESAGHTPAANGRKHMDQAFLAAKLGLSAEATEAQITERLNALTILEADVVRVGGDPNARKALGTIEALVDTGRKAKQIEATAIKARVDAMLLSARQTKGLTLAEAESLLAKGATDPDWLEGHLASMSSRLPPVQVEAKGEPVETDAAPEAEKHGGKTYAQMSFSERADLHKADAKKFNRMKSAHDARKG